MKCVVCKASVSNMRACARCGLVQKSPMPSEEEIESLYHEDLEHFEPYIEQLAVHRAYFRQKVKEIVIAGAEVARPKRLLDIGCAMGVLLEEARKAGFTVQGIDISKDAVLYCRKKKLDVYEGTLISVGDKVKKSSFDVITAFEIIEHERDPMGLMRRVHELLNAGGIAVLTTPNHSGIWRKIMGRWWVGYRHPEHVTFWDPVSLTYLMKRAGFAKVEVRRDLSRPFPLSFLFTRGADYFPWAAWLLRPAGKALDHLKIINPINPWDDLIVYARK